MAVRDPAEILGQPSKESLEWVFRDFCRYYPYESAKAEEIYRSLIQYALCLDNQLDLTAHLGSTDRHVDSHGQKASGEIWRRPRILVDVEDTENGSLFHSLLWESLECIHRLHNVEAKWIYIVRRIGHSKQGMGQRNLDDAAQAPTKPLRAAPRRHRPAITKPTFNILLAVSRPDKNEDIDPYLACDAISDLLVDMGPKDSAKFRLEISRPGTWSAFKKHVSSRTEAWHLSGGDGPWFDVVHFDVHGVVQDGAARLRFVSGSGRNEYRPSFEEVGSLLQSNAIRTVVFNSCDSARVTKTEESNMALKLLSFGVQDVVAMQFPLTSTAASHFVKAFYSFYLTGTYSISEATHLARQVLFGIRSRDTYLSVQVELPDFVVPVLYHDEPAGASDEVAAVSKLPKPSKQMIQASEMCSSLDAEFKSWGPFLGRNYDGMAVEWQLFREKSTNVILITGEHGCGKTTFSQWLMRWWFITGVATLGCAFSYKSRDESNILSLLKELYDSSRPDHPERLESLISQLISNPFVIHIDSVECLSSPSMSVAMGPVGDVNDEDKAHLKDFIRRLKGGRTIVILNSISNESWLELPRYAVYELGALSHPHACRLAHAILRTENLGDKFQDPDSISYIGYMMYMLHCNPSAIINTIKGLVLTPTIATNAPTMFNVLLVAYLAPNLGESQLRECLEFIRRIHARYISDTPRVLLLLGLAAPTNSFTPRFFEYLSSAVNSFYPGASLTAQDALEFVEGSFIGSSWIQKGRARVPNSGGEKQQFYLVHPLLTNILRFVLDQGQYHENMPFLLQSNGLSMESYCSWQQHLFKTFYHDLALRALALLGGEASASAESYFNTLNYLAALHSFSKDNSNVSTDPDLAVFALTIWLPITNVLWEHAVESISATIPFDILLGHATTAIKLFEARSQPDNPTYDGFAQIYRRLCFHLYRFYISKSPRKSLPFVGNMLEISCAPLTSTNPLDLGQATRLADDLWDLVNSYLSLGKRFASSKIALVVGVVLCRAVAKTVEEQAEYYAHVARTCQALFQVSKQGDRTYRHNFDMLILDLMKKVADEKSVPLPTQYFDDFRKPKKTRTGSTGGRGVQEVIDIGWESENYRIDRSNVVKAIDTSQMLLAARQTDKAKACFVELLRQALGSGDMAAQFACQRGLALLYYDLREWDTAGRHAQQAMELLSKKRNSRADWMPWSDEEYNVMHLKFAIIFAELDRWPLAIHAFNHVLNVDGPTQSGWNPPQLSHFQTPVEFADYAKEALMTGLALLSLPPQFLISSSRVRELRRKFVEWLRDVSPIAWPQFDLSKINVETLVGDVDVTQLPDHPSSLELNELLARYQAYMVDSSSASDCDVERSAVRNKLNDAIELLVSHSIGPNVKLVKETDFPGEKLGGGETPRSSDGIANSNDNVLPHASNTNPPGEQEGEEGREQVQQVPMPRGILVSPEFYIKLGWAMGVDEAQKLDLHLPANHFVCWEVLVRTISFYVRASSVTPLSENVRLSGTVYHLLEAIYRGEAVVAANPSNEAIRTVIGLLLDEHGDGETDKMNDALRLLFPEFMAAEATRSVPLLDPHPGLTIPI